MKRNAWIPGVNAIKSWGIPDFLDTSGNIYHRAIFDLVEPSVEGEMRNILTHIDRADAVLYFVIIRKMELAPEIKIDEDGMPIPLYGVHRPMFSKVKRPLKGDYIRAKLSEGSACPKILVLEADYSPSQTTGYVVLKPVPARKVHIEAPIACLAKYPF